MSNSNNSVKYDYLFKIVLAGDSGVGKSSILLRYCSDEFNLEQKMTIGIEFRSHDIEIENSKIKAQVWDTAGNERFRAVTPVYYRGAYGAILVYDITNHNTFQSLQYWLEEIRSRSNNPDVVLMLIGNKCDLKKLRAVPTDEARRFAEENGLSFLETSALDSTNVKLAFQIVLEKIFMNMKEKRELEIDQNIELTHIENSKIKAQVWDTAGNERFRAVTPVYYRGAYGAILVYDITNHNTFQSLQYWLEEIKSRSNNPDVVLMLIGNKCDLKKLRAVPTDEARRFAEENGLPFLETSALDSTNVKLAFQIVLEKIFMNMKEKRELEIDQNIELIRVNQREEEGRKKCC
uniref:Uncharacterized protein n=1 Tax=Acrobeloides nanus TaxID=290746 RepID=A0A914DIM1_9BILA